MAIICGDSDNWKHVEPHELEDGLHRSCKFYVWFDSPSPLQYNADVVLMAAHLFRTQEAGVRFLSSAPWTDSRIGEHAGLLLRRFGFKSRSVHHYYAPVAK
jgi:hypothetical protein